jgi:hypothetical protein
MADNKDLLANIEKGAQLKHVEIAKDASVPHTEGTPIPFSPYS